MHMKLRMLRIQFSSLLLSLYGIKDTTKKCSIPLWNLHVKKHHAISSFQRTTVSKCLRLLLNYFPKIALWEKQDYGLDKNLKSDLCSSYALPY